MVLVGHNELNEQVNPWINEQYQILLQEIKLF